MYEINILNEIIKLITKIDKHISKRERHTAAPFGLTPSQVKVILNIDNDHSLTHSHLAKKCHFSKSTLSEILDIMERKKLIERRRCDKDRRKVYVSLTPKGFSCRNSLLMYGSSHKISRDISMTDLEKKLLYILLKKFYNQIS